MELRYEELSAEQKRVLLDALRTFRNQHTSSGAYQATLTELIDDIDIGIAKILYAPAHVWRETRIGAKPD